MNPTDRLINTMQEQIMAGNVAMDDAYRAIAVHALAKRGTHPEILELLRTTPASLDDHMNDADCIAVSQLCEKVMQKISALEDALGEAFSPATLPGAMQRTLKHITQTELAAPRTR